MDKHSYETYEFLTSTSTDPDTNQFYVLQDDGTILTVNKEIQYIAQVHDNKQAVENLNSEGCAAVFDVSSQQYYVDVESSTPEIISINDEFTVANAENNVYTSSYLMESENNSDTQNINIEPTVDPQKLDTHQLQKHNIEAFNGAKQTSDMTEITLTDEQYQILEQKGWLLMESNNRIFVLNTLGLHDITTNPKLIQKLKKELQDSTQTNTHIEHLKIETITVDLPSEGSDKAMQTQDDIVQYLIAKNIPIEHENTNMVENIQLIADDNTVQGMGEPMELNQNSEINSLAQEPMSISKLINNGDGPHSDSPKKCDSIKIKTKYTFTDIPDKIFLGKTVNGKKLYAKVTKLKNGSHNKNDKKTQEITMEKKNEKKLHNNAIMDGVWFTDLIQDSFRHFMTATDAKFVAVASAVVSQLLRLPDFKDLIAGTNLVITKIITSETINGKEIGQPKMVIGTIKHRDGENTFVHVPQLLHELLDNSGKSIKHENNSKTKSVLDLDSPEEKTARDVIELLHIHISETRSIDKALQTSINLCKRKLPLDVLIDAKKKYPNPVYACGSCGALFKSESSLKDHQNDQCIEVEDELTIDTSHADDFNSNETLYTIEVNGREKIYSCVICETKFTRLFNCQKHIKAHKTSIEKKLKVYKCKMCPSAFVHSSSLSKHIVKIHIQTQMN